jgi:hypothetical protein
MAYKWKPSKSQRTEFANKMKNDSEFAANYYNNKAEKQNKKRETSKFDYNGAGGSYVPTETQNNFAMNNTNLFTTYDEIQAMSMVMYGFSCKEKINHDYIHIVNEKIRNSNQI